MIINNITTHLILSFCILLCKVAYMLCKNIIFAQLINYNYGNSKSIHPFR